MIDPTGEASSSDSRSLRERWASATDPQRYGLLFVGLACAALVNAPRVTAARAVYFVGIAAVAVLVAAGMAFSRRPVTRSAGAAFLLSVAFVQLVHDGLRGAGVTLSGAGLAACSLCLARELWRLRADEVRAHRKLVLVAALLHIGGRRGAAEDAHAAAGHESAWTSCQDPTCAEERRVCANVEAELHAALARLLPPADPGHLPWV